MEVSPPPTTPGGGVGFLTMKGFPPENETNPTSCCGYKYEGPTLYMVGSEKGAWEDKSLAVDSG